MHEDFTLQIKFWEVQLLDLAPVQDVRFDEESGILLRVYILEEIIVLHEVYLHARVEPSVLVGDLPIGSVLQRLTLEQELVKRWLVPNRSNHLAHPWDEHVEQE